jgi:DNA-binding NarL/FixJ family response regulator
VLLLTAAIDPQDLAAALTVGVRGVVMKQSAAAVLVDHIRRVMRGQAWVGDVASAPEAESDLDFGLTAREAEVASAVAAGYGNKDIARRLAISEKTVKHHLTRIFDKLGVSTRLELALLVVRHERESSDVPLHVEAAPRTPP